MTINNLLAKILKRNNFIAEILKINNLTPDELHESKEFNRNFENGGFFFLCNFLDGMYTSVHESECFDLDFAEKK
jgi:hypothetical protein